MTSLALLSFFAWALTILAPCVLPVLPVVLAGSITEKKPWYPYIVTLSLAISVVLFTVLLKVSTALIDIPPEFWQYLSWGILIALGLIYLFPHVWTWIWENCGFSRSNTSLDKAQDIGSPLLRAIATGAALGPVFSTCSPTYSLLLATVFPVSLLAGIGYTIIYAFWLSLMLTIIAVGGRSVILRFRGIADERWWFKKILGIIFILIGLAIVTGFDKKIQTKAIEYFDITRFESTLIDRYNPSKKMNALLDVNAPTWTNPLVLSGGSPDGSPNTFVPSLSVKVPYKAPAIPPELTEWINSNPLTMESLKWKVVIIDFWTYSCINCQRTLPYLTAWDQKYRDQWLVILGVHAPEFAFEKKRVNVEKAMKTANIAYPVILDNTFDLWNAYENQYWPAKYFIDREGNVRHTHFWEWAYEESEKVIQYLLGLPSASIISVDPPKFASLQSPETYLGLSRRENYKSFPAEQALNEWTLSPGYEWEKWDPKGKYGKLSDYWKQGEESITAKKSWATLTFHYKAKDIYLVLWWTGTVQVSTNSKEWNNFGKDLQDGVLTIDSDRMYHIISSSSSSENLLFLEFSEWVEAFAFTFGS